MSRSLHHRNSRLFLALASSSTVHFVLDRGCAVVRVQSIPSQNWFLSGQHRLDFYQSSQALVG